VVGLSPESARLAGVAVARAGVGRLELEIRVPGEIGFNEDRLAHVSPRFEGIVRDVSGQVGSSVRRGEELARIESNTSLSEYTLVSPIDGAIVEKHITPGEFVAQDSNLFTIADLSSVWVNLDVPSKYVGRIRTGQSFRLQSLGGELHALAETDYTAPILHATTRSGLARLVLPNPDGDWRPGTFVTGTTRLDAAEPTVLVNRDAVQRLDGEAVVFTPLDDGRYATTPVVTGLSNQDRIQILDGLESGDIYVCTGAFELKASLMLGALGGHAGHGH
jgi:cobalt-zinc-cadmium efflux system membrane fusion protein